MGAGHEKRAMSSTWQDDPFEFDDPLFGNDFEQADDDGSPSRTGRRRRSGRGVLLIAVVSLASAGVSLAMGANHAGWATVAVGAAAYALAATADLRYRRLRRSRRMFNRPWATALLRVVVFWAAVGAAWLAAAGLAAA